MKDLVAELKLFHHHEAAKRLARLEQLLETDKLDAKKALMVAARRYIFEFQGNEANKDASKVWKWNLYELCFEIIRHEDTP